MFVFRSLRPLRPTRSLRALADVPLTPFALAALALVIAFVLSFALGCADPSNGETPPQGATGEGEGEGEGEGVDGEGEGVDGEGEVGEEGEGEGEGASAGEGEGEQDTPPPSSCSDGGVVNVPGCTSQGDGDFECSLEHDGLARTFDMHVPASYTGAPTSIVFSFHGLRTNAALQRYISKGNDGSEADGYIVIYPEGTGPSTEQAWNAGVCCAGASANDVDDVGFTLAILAHLQASMCIDDARVYATGLSNGGHMSYRLACEEADVFAAIASVAGLTTVTTCNPSRPVPVLHFHGTSDAIVSYSVGISGVGAEETVANWANKNGCSTEAEVTYQQGEVTCRSFLECDDSSAAELCTVQGGGHTWPGGNDVVVLGHTTQDISATDYIGAFFAAHPMP